MRMMRGRRPVIGSAWGYVKESRKYIYTVAIIFLIGAFMGMAFQSRLWILDDMLRELVKRVESLGVFELIWFIFKNNLMSSFFALLFGIFLGLFPVFTSAFNGVILGYVFSRAADADGFGVMYRLLPHGVFELPAVLISMGLGLRLGLGFFENYFAFHKKDALRKFICILAALGGITGLLFVFVSISSFFVDAGDVSWVGIPLVSSIIGLVFGLLLVWPMIYLLFFSDRKLRKMQKESFILRFYRSIKVFFYVVLPLLLIAAIIEGILIFAYR